MRFSISARLGSASLKHRPTCDANSASISFLLASLASWSILGANRVAAD